MPSSTIRIALLALVLCAASLLRAAVPQAVNYQGRLTDSLGDPVADGNYQIIFTLYSDASSFAPSFVLWTSGTRTITVTDGLFSYGLGSNVPLPDDLFANDTLCWLGIKVASDPELSPRVKMSSTAYAYHALRADTAGYTYHALSADTADYTYHALDADTADYAITGGGSSNGWVDDGTIVHLETISDAVGIGTSTPSEKLEVTGNIRVSGKAVVGSNCQNNGNYSFVAGENNSSSMSHSAIGGGEENYTLYDHSVVSGGYADSAKGSHATVGGGYVNTASGGWSTVGGGISNVASGERSTVGGGEGNKAEGYTSVISGGWINRVTGMAGAVTGGQHNSVEAAFSTISGGYGDTITSTAEYSYLFGIKSKLSQDSTFMVDMPHIRFGDETGGYEFPSVDGSDGQVLTTDGSGLLDWTDIGGGGSSHWAVADSVLATNSYWGIARGGAGNVRYGDSLQTIINFGVACTTGTSGESYNLDMTVSGGYGNAATKSYATVAGGFRNRAAGYYNSVGGGYSNKATGWNYSTVAGGYNNTASGSYATVAGGQFNVAANNESFVGSGLANQTNGQYSNILGGAYNTSDFAYGVIGGGYQNQISSAFGIVGNGEKDTVGAAYGGVFSGYLCRAGDAVSDSAAFVGGGIRNKARAKCATVAGGKNNQADGDYSAVLGGYQNQIGGTRCVIPGGWNNSIAATASYSMVFGDGAHADSSYRVIFFDESMPGRLGINRDDFGGGISYPIHVGTNTSNGNGAYLTNGGTWTSTSSRDVKENFEPVDGAAVLELLADMPVDSWQYRESDERHIGPVSEDFVAAFDVGATGDDGSRDNKHLSANDVAGVALIAIQELTRQLKEKDEQITELNARLTALEQSGNRRGAGK